MQGLFLCVFAVFGWGAVFLGGRYFVGGRIFVEDTIFVGRPTPRSPWARSPTIAVRSLRSGLPRCHLRPPSAPFRFPRAHRRRSHPRCPRRRAARVFGMSRCKTCMQGRGSAGPPNCCRPGGGNRHRSRGSSVRCALARWRKVVFWWALQRGGGGDGRRASSDNGSLPTCTRAAHRALELT
jgi:hypothetical protein